MASKEKLTSTPSKDGSKVKETLDFLLHSYRAKLAVDNPSESCPFNFTEFLENWKDKYENWDELKSAMIRDLEPLANEGLFDSILPYLTASLNQSKCNKDFKKQGGGSCLKFQENIISAELTPIAGDGASSVEKLKKVPESGIDFNPEIIIHVCDEAKCLKKDFYCLQSILVKEMGYFTKVTVKGQRLCDMDISVHCDISVFEWLMKWVKSQNGGYEQAPVLDPTNVIGLMVSADFLQMATLVSECLNFTATNISQVINQSPNLGCLNESLTSKILHFFNNFELETRINHIDKTDRITSRLYTQLIMALNDSDPDETLGHFASTATLFKCNICGKLLINNVASKVTCATVKCDCRGRIYACHVRDPNWTLGQFIRDLKKELKLWKNVYWRLWSLVHFFFCSECEQYFPANCFSSCGHHSAEPVQSVVVVSKAPGGDVDDVITITSKGDNPPRISSARRSIHLKSEKVDNLNFGGYSEPDGNSDTIVCPYGVFPCCKQPSYQFFTFPHPQSSGCEFKDHAVGHYAEDDPALKLITSFRELIVVDPSPMEKYNLDWATLIDFTPQKLPSTSSASVFSQRAITTSMYGDLMQRRRMLLRNESSSTESNSLSDNEEIFPKVDETLLTNQRYSASDFWCWNPEYTTRYNQDMQREREEKLMADLEMLLAQRVAIDSGSTGFPSSIRLGYLSRRTQKTNGGSFLKLEEQWKEEVQQNGFTKVTKQSIRNIQNRATATTRYVHLPSITGMGWSTLTIRSLSYPIVVPITGA